MQVKLNVTNALSYATYAVSTPEDSAASVEWFSARTASNIIWNWRRRQRFRDGLADYAKLRELGVHFSHLENQAALCAVSLRPPDEKGALEAIKRAVSLNKTDSILLANLGYIEFLVGSRAEANRAFKSILKSYALPPVYIGPAALSAFTQHELGESIVPKSELIDQLKRALALDEAKHLRGEIEAALSRLSDLTLQDLLADEAPVLAGSDGDSGASGKLVRKTRIQNSRSPRIAFASHLFLSATSS